MQKFLENIIGTDRRLVDAAKSIKILSNLSWPAAHCQAFLAGWQRGNARLPDIQHPHLDYGQNIEALEQVIRYSSGQNPLERYLKRTAESYVIAAKMLQNVGKIDFVQYSAELYGRPDDPIGSENITHLNAADHFIRVTGEFMQSGTVDTHAHTLTPQAAAEELAKSFAEFFKFHPVQVIIDPNLASKAVAGSNKVRIRALTTFSPTDVAQLTQHEGFVHTATLINGREQPNLKSLGLGAPRTTKTQEGLATLAELITFTMDVSRLRRLALRIKAVHNAMSGADFLDVFKLFLESGQSEAESFYSAMRVFRGGDVRGKVAFTKDIVYLQGLILTYSFLRRAIQENKIELMTFLFSGRM